MNYLDIEAPIINFSKTLNSKIYVDKSLLIKDVEEYIDTDQRFICITRPRRFGKSINAYMLGAYFTKGYDSHELFDHLLIAKTDTYEKHLNKHHVIYIDFSKMPDPCDTYREYVDYVKLKLFEDLQQVYGVEKQERWSIGDYLCKTEDSFIFILDEWDSIFYKNFMTDDDKKAYLDFLNGLLKGQPYVELAYMTGVLPIAKYSSGSALNVFGEYSFMQDDVFEAYFGFNELEVRELCKQYTKIPYEELKYWYDGYMSEEGGSLFNPRSVSYALLNGKCRNYWTETGPMDTEGCTACEIADCIKNNVKAVREDIVKMVSNIPVKIKLKGYSASDLKLSSRDAILSAMVVYGFLSYRDSYVQIPNHELMLKFEDVLVEENLYGLAEVINNSEEMLNATIKKDADKVAQNLREIHAREVTLFKYNDDAEWCAVRNSLACVITLCYLNARDYYTITREQQSGEGYVDFLFHPEREGYPAIVLELKKDHSAQQAIQQIKERNYVDRVRDHDMILLVGINYNSKTKEHTCIIEEFKK